VPSTAIVAVVFKMGASTGSRLHGLVVVSPADVGSHGSVAPARL